MNKADLRNKYQKLRTELSSEEIEDLSLEIANQCLLLPIWEHTYYHLFLSIATKKEVNTDYLLHILHGKDKSVIIPKANFENGEMTHFLLQENTVLKLSDYQIPEPVSGIEIASNALEVVFVPLLAVDLKGNRIGYGKGFYDRFLENCSPNAIFIGLSFFQPETEIISEKTDVPLHFCVTPEKIYSF